METGAGEPVRDKDQGAPVGGVQVAETHVTGNVGLTQAILHFQRLNWGPVDNTREDAGSGIDLFVSARDGQRVELGQHLSAQVKGGESWFKELGVACLLITPDQMLIVDVADDCDRQAIEEAELRRADYRRRGWTMEMQMAARE